MTNDNEVSGDRPNEPSRSRGRQDRGGRPSRGWGGRRGRGDRQRNPQAAERRNEQLGTTTAVSVPVVDRTTPHATRDGGAPRGRGRRGTRGSGRGRANTAGGQRTSIAASRVFGGHLTAEAEPEDQSSEISTAMNASASVFVPGQPFVRSRYVITLSISSRWRRLTSTIALKEETIPLRRPLVGRPGLALPISPPGFTKILPMDNMSVSSVLMKFCGTHVSGPVRSAGPPLTCHALRSGSRIGPSRLTKSNNNNNLNSKHGGAPAAIRL